MMHQLIYVMLISSKGCFIFDVYWTMHHGDNSIIKNLLDATCDFTELLVV